MSRYCSRTAGYIILSIIDLFSYFLIRLLPGPLLLQIVRHRPWKRCQLPLPAKCQQLWKGRIAWLLRHRCRRAGWGSTCLSRSLSGRLLLDLVGVPNELHLGMSKFNDGRKVPHAWLRDPESGRLFTPGLTPGAGAALTHF